MRQQVRRANTAGLVALTGAGGRGFERAGMQIANLGASMSQDEARKKALDDANKLRIQKEKDAYENKIALQGAQRAKNYITNPTAVSAMNKQFGITGQLAQDPTAPTLANANLGLVDLGKPEQPKAHKVKSKFVDDKNFIHLVYDDGTTQNTNVKSKDYQTSSKSSKKDAAPQGYKFAGEFNINDDLDYELAVAGAYFTDKNGKRYVNMQKYNNLVDLGNTQIR